MLAALLAPVTVRAQGAGTTIHDSQLWGQWVALLPVAEAWTVHAEAQFRWNDDLGNHDQDIFRGAVGRRVSPRVTLWGGYAYNPRWTGGVRFDERRTWEQASVTLPTAGKWAPSLRIRQEQRYLAEWGDTSHRLRLLGRFVRPIGGSPWSVALWDEYMVTLDHTEGGPRQGFDQNRAFVGILRTLSREVTIEGGHLWQMQPSNAARGPRHGHTAFAWLTYAPQRR